MPPTDDAEKLREWMEKTLRALGQMRHDKNLDRGMVMEVETRRDLIHEGCRLLGYKV